jgi:hypothetical protein
MLHWRQVRRCRPGTRTRSWSWRRLCMRSQDRSWSNCRCPYRSTCQRGTAGSCRCRRRSRCRLRTCSTAHMDGHAHACARRNGTRHHRPPLAHCGGASRRPLAGCAGSAGRAVVVLARRTRDGARFTARRGAWAWPAARAGRQTQRGAVPPSRTLRTCTDGFAWMAWCWSRTPWGMPHSPRTVPRSRSSWSLRAHAVRGV